MQKVLTPDQMREVERRYMAASGTTSLALMERAAQGVARVAQGVARVAQSIGASGGRSAPSGSIAILACGPGGNGGDGFAAARLYADARGKAIVVPLCADDELSNDARVNCDRAREHPGVAFARICDVDRLPVPAVWVDALFGIGLSRPMSERCHPLIRRIANDRALGARVLAVDIASGLDAYTGRAQGEAVVATDTVTFECPKPGHFLQDGIDHTGALHACALGIPESMLPADAILRATHDDVRARLNPRARNSHKGTYGHLLIVAGSFGMAGAAVLAARGALKSGAGLVTVACPESIVPIVQANAPCAMCAPLPEVGGVLAPGSARSLERLIDGKAALAIGPGLTGRVAPEVVRVALDCGLPAVIDADALNILSQNADLRARLAPRHLLTPHPGEARRLLGGDNLSPIDAARALAALHCTALYKGASSVIAGSATYIRTDGCAGLAKGGTGDVLTGILGALLAQGYPVEQAAWMGAVAHGAAGERAAKRLGEIAMTAQDVAEHLHEVWRDA